MKPDERALMLELARLPHIRHEFATDVGIALGIHVNRVEYILDKWAGKDWWDCGVSLRTGWLTEKGLAKAKELVLHDKRVRRQRLP